MSFFIQTDLISSLFDLRLVDPGTALIHVGAYGPKCRIHQRVSYLIQDQRVLGQANYDSFRLSETMASGSLKLTFNLLTAF